MIDGNVLAELIESRRRFKIGTRGICIICSPAIYPRGEGWTISIPRAFVVVTATDLSILDDEDYYHLTYDPNDSGTYYSIADLTKYDRITVMI